MFTLTWQAEISPLSGRPPTRAPTRAPTRERVLDVALALANARGLDRVTTAEIAEASGINEGNLYYYFQRKAQIAEALFDRFELALLEVGNRPLHDPADPMAYVAYQRGWFDLMSEYRLFYRDAAMLRILAPGLRDRAHAVTLRGQQAVRAVFQQMRAHGLMHATDAEIERLIDNLWIVSSYWMDFRGLQGPHDLAWGYRQVLTLYAPYLTARARSAYAEAGQALP